MQQERKFDKNTLVAFILMGFLLLGYFYLSQPSEEELKEQARQEQLAKEKVENEKDSLIAIQQSADTIAASDSTVLIAQAKDLETENAKFKVKFAGKGGSISELLLKEFSAFDENGEDHKKPLYLINDGNNEFNLKFKDKSGREIHTSQLAFSPSVQKSDSVSIITMTAPVDGGKLQFIYTVGTNYTIGFEVKSEGIHQITNDKNIGVT